MKEPWSVAGKTIVITGASGGIGLESAKQLANLGARVVLIARNRARLDAAVQEVERHVRTTSAVRQSGTLITDEGVPFLSPLALLCDFSSQSSIRNVATELLATLPRIDVLVNNAGGVQSARRLSPDGIELTFATNHLGYFLLTNLLIDRIKASSPARIVTVASIGHRRGRIDFDDLGFERGGYSTLNAYTRSKLANVLFSNELARRLRGTGVTSNSVHPGGVATNIWSGAPAFVRPVITLFVRPFLITPEEGGATITHLAASQSVTGVTGGYFENNVLSVPAATALDQSVAKRLWDVSAKLVNLQTTI